MLKTLWRKWVVEPREARMRALREAEELLPTVKELFRETLEKRAALRDAKLLYGHGHEVLARHREYTLAFNGFEAQRKRYIELLCQADLNTGEHINRACLAPYLEYER